MQEDGSADFTDEDKADKVDDVDEDVDTFRDDNNDIFVYRHVAQDMSFPAIDKESTQNAAVGVLEDSQEMFWSLMAVVENFCVGVSDKFVACLGF